MTLLPIDIVGFWIGIFLTFAILSYLYKDNPFYKLAEHLFVGISIGAVIMQQWYNTLRPNFFDPLFKGKVVLLVPLALVGCMFIKAASQKLAWLGRYPIAFVVAFYAGFQINAVAQSNLAEQMKASMQPVVAKKVDVNTADVGDLATLPGLSPSVGQAIVTARAEGIKLTSLADIKNLPGLNDEQKRDVDLWRGSLTGLDAKASVSGDAIDWFGTFSNFLLLVGLCASLWYFYFSIEQKGAMGHVAKVGVWVLMIGFGASFGMTVQGRLALAVGRAMEVLGKDRDPAQAAQIHGPVVSIISILILIGGIAWWEIAQKRKAQKPPTDGPTPPDGSDDLPAY